MVNTLDEMLNFTCTPGNVDDRQHVPSLVAALHGRVFADKGYLSKPLQAALAQTDLRLVTDQRRNMSAPALDPDDRRCCVAAF